MTIPAIPLRQSAIDILRALLGQANSPAMRQGAREILEHEVPGFGGPLTLNATREAIPGLGTGALADALLRAPDDVRAAYSQMASEVPVWQSTGRSIEPSRAATGSYQLHDTAPLETNPLNVSRPHLNPTYTKRRALNGIAGGNLTLKQGEIPLAKKLEALAGMADVQNASAAHVMLPGGGSGYSALSRATTPDEMKRLVQTFGPQGYSPVDTGAGLSLMNFNGPTQEELMQKLPTLNAQLQQMVPDASAILPTNFAKSGLYNDFSRALHESNAGQGTASQQLVKMLTGTKNKGKPLVNALDNTPGFHNAFLERNERDAYFAKQLGVKNREDIMTFRSIVGNDGLKKFIKAVNDGIIALPAAAAFIQQTIAGHNESSGNTPEDTHE